MAVGLNYNVYVKYLSWLQEKGLVTIKDIDERRSVVSITEKGVEAYHTMAAWIKDVIGDILNQANPVHPLIKSVLCCPKCSKIIKSRTEPLSYSNEGLSRM